MGKVILIEPGKEAAVVDHGDVVTLEDLQRFINTDCVSARTLGPIPTGDRRVADVWFDDEGLLKDDTVPNRQIGPETIVVGNMLLCARNEEGDSLPFTSDEAEVVRAHVDALWDRLRPDHPKPEPTYTIRSFDADGNETTHKYDRDGKETT